MKQHFKVKIVNPKTIDEQIDEFKRNCKNQGFKVTIIYEEDEDNG